MIPIPADVAASYGVAPWSVSCTVTVEREGNPDNAVVLDVVGGEVTWDATRWPRTEASIEVPFALTPGANVPPASPFGDRVGIDVTIDAVGLDPVTFRAATLAVHAVHLDRPENVATIEAVSFEALVNEDRSAIPWQTDAAGSTSAEIIRIVRRTLGASWPASTSLTSNPALAAGAIRWDGDTWPVIEQLAERCGAEVFFDASGTLVIRDERVRASTPDVTYRVGERGTIVGYRSSRRWGASKVALTFDDGASTVTGVWEDTVTTSATRTSGPYGRHTVREFIDVPTGKLPTAPEADAAAATLAKRRAATYRRVEVDVVPTPWVLPGDTARLEFLGGPNELHLVAATRWPLSGLSAGRIITTDARYTGGPF